MNRKILIILFGIIAISLFILFVKWFANNMCLVDCELTPEVEFQFITKVEEFFN